MVEQITNDSLYRVTFSSKNKKNSVSRSSILRMRIITCILTFECPTLPIRLRGHKCSQRLSQGYQGMYEDYKFLRETAHGSGLSSIFLFKKIIKAKKLFLTLNCFTYGIF